jgi:hypothetical protein
MVAAVERYVRESRRQQMAQAVLDITDGAGIASDALEALHVIRRENERA